MAALDRLHPRHRAFLIFLLIAVPVLLFLGWSQASLSLNFIRPETASQTILLLALSTTIFLAFLIFSLILTRILLKLYIERHQRQLGSRFKTKMVVAFLALSLVPVGFLFFYAYGLINRSIDKWFGIPFDMVRRDSTAIVNQLEARTEERAADITADLAASMPLAKAVAAGQRSSAAAALKREALDPESEWVVCYDTRGRVLTAEGGLAIRPGLVASLSNSFVHKKLAPDGVTVRRPSGSLTVFLSARPLQDASGARIGTIIAVTRLPASIRHTAEEIGREAQKYDELSRQWKGVKRVDLSMLGLVTLLILFIAAWLALFIAKQVTVPIQALAAATHEVSQGNLAHRISARADDELGILIRSFNEMTQQLQENRWALEHAANDLQAANRQLEERSHTMEAILENIPTGVVSFDPRGQVTQLNSTAERMFGLERAKSARSLGDLLAPEDARQVAHLFRRAARQGVLTRPMELDLDGRRSSLAVTVSSIRARHGAVGTLLVLEDLSELLRAQKAAAWQEVAQRLAHEIKNPLTPIELSAQRIRRWIDRAGQPDSPELRAAVSESASLISREVAALKTLVDEFSQFARLPAARPLPSHFNGLVGQALEVFEGRLGGITIHRDLAELPTVQADPDQMKRVLVNLIDNAAEALESAPLKEIWIRTALDAERDVVELVVADSGPGIPAEAKARLFLPYFSTKQRGTGLGLAIVSRIVSDHHGTIRVEENHPVGTRFVIELPIERAPAAVAPA